ncbi:hypothetical protein T01_6157 [Trichinella spiralis]|uniref:Uncharacterized protein n=1 Tax=Trichinella spiralis TaxID=6334 RepID=A0A0V1BNU4_TRISP|nr:hypothetical protein T01_6157 [Trichinella spiralis]
MNNEEKKKRKHGRFVEEADRGRHETDHRRHEADRGRHEAEQEKTKGICGSPWVPILQGRVQTLPCSLGRQSARSSSLERGKPRLSALKRRVRLISTRWRRYDVPKSSVKGSSLQRHNE